MGGYKFEGKIGRDAPRQDEYTFYRADVDNSGNYSESTKVTVQHPGIQQLQLEEQDVNGLLSTIKIKLPKVFSEVSQTVYPEDVTSEQKEIISYRLHIQELDYDTEEPINEEEIIDVDTEEVLNRIYYYQAETGKKFEVKVGAYDSVYHPDYNEDLYEQTISDGVIAETSKIELEDIPDGLLDPSKLTESLQDTIDTSYQYATITNPERMDNIEGDVDDAFTGINQNENAIETIAVDLNKDIDEPDYEYTFLKQTADEFSITASRIDNVEGDLEDAEGEITELNTQMDIVADGFMVRTQKSEDGELVAAGGFGLALDEDGDNDIDFNVIADQFRVFPTTDEEGNLQGEPQPIFGIDANEDFVYIDADTTAIYSNYDDGEYDGVFELSSEGLQIDTPNFTLYKNGNAEFGGEIQATTGNIADWSITDNSLYKDTDDFEFSLGSADELSWSSAVVGYQFGVSEDERIWIGDVNGSPEIGINHEGDRILQLGGKDNFISGDILIETDNFEFTSSNLNISSSDGIYNDNISINTDGSAEFSGTLEAVEGDFVGLTAADGSIEVESRSVFYTGDYPALVMYNEDDKVVEIQETAHAGAINQGGSLKLYNENEEQRCFLETTHNDYGSLRIYDASSDLTFRAEKPSAIEQSTAEVYGDMWIEDDLEVEGTIYGYKVVSEGGDVKLHDLPTSDPEEENQLYRDGNDLKISTG